MPSKVPTDDCHPECLLALWQELLLTKRQAHQVSLPRNNPNLRITCYCIEWVLPEDQGHHHIEQSDHWGHWSQLTLPEQPRLSCPEATTASPALEESVRHVQDDIRSQQHKRDRHPPTARNVADRHTSCRARPWR